jgi:hypothetical protein
MANKVEKKSFVMYKDWHGIFASLPDADAAQLIRAVFAYQCGETYTFANATLQTMFETMIVPVFERDANAYAERVAALRINGAKGGRPKKSKENHLVIDESKENLLVSEKTKCNQKKRVYVYDNVNDNNNNSSNEESLKHDVSTGIPQVEINDALGMVERFWHENKPSGWKSFSGNNVNLKRLEHFKECFAVCGNNVNTFNAVLKHIFVSMTDAPELYETASYNQFDNLVRNIAFFRRCYESAKGYWHGGK